jgi:Fe-S-cluster containining protein
MNNANFSITQNPGEIEHTTTDFTKNGECSQCGACCTDHLVVTDAEIKRIQQYINANNVKPIMHAPLLMANSVDYLCPFVDMTKPTEKCTIYNIRPEICRCFKCSYADITEEELDSPDVVNMVKLLRDSKTKNINLWHTFFPKTHLPKQGDIVVANTFDIQFYELHKGRTFLMMHDCVNVDGINLATICPCSNPTIQIKCNAAGLTKVMNPVT